MADFKKWLYLMLHSICDLEIKFGTQLNAQGKYLPKGLGTSFILSELSADRFSLGSAPILALPGRHYGLFYEQFFSANFLDMNYIHIMNIILL